MDKHRRREKDERRRRGRGGAKRSVADVNVMWRSCFCLSLQRAFSDTFLMPFFAFKARARVERILCRPQRQSTKYRYHEYWVLHDVYKWILNKFFLLSFYRVFIVYLESSFSPVFCLSHSLFVSLNVYDTRALSSPRAEISNAAYI
jgi:hypothetical protein